MSPPSPPAALDPVRLGEALRQAAVLSAALLSARSIGDVRRLAASAGAMLGGGPALLLSLSPDAALRPQLHLDESEGLPRARLQQFRFELSESFEREIFERAAQGENPPGLERALVSELGFERPVIYPLGAGQRLRGIFVADARASAGLGPLLPPALRQLAAVVAGAVAAAEAHATAARLGVLDPVTGLYDRHSAEIYLRRELARARRYREPLSLVLIDLDRFSDLNEQRGYQGGDRVLKEVARLLIGFPAAAKELTGLALCFRESDLAARFGADSFLVMLPATARGGAGLAAERFLAGLRQHRVQLERSSVGVSATAAVVSFPDDGDGADELTSLADALVSEAARAGGDRLVLAQPSPRSTS